MTKTELINDIIQRRNNINRRANQAKMDGDIFREFVIKDDRTGKSIVQEPMHKSWVKHIKRCEERNKHCAIIAPWGHGKTVQIAIAETLFRIGHNQELRIKIVNSSDTYAMDRVKSIKAYIEQDEQYKMVFPEVQRDENQQWTDHRIYIKRKGHAIDPTIEARGITSTGVGGRADVLIFDDPVDENSIVSEKIRDTIRNKYQNLWMSRLVDDGFVLYICTRWHDDDLTATILESKRYSVLIQSISEDFSYIEEDLIE